MARLIDAEPLEEVFEKQANTRLYSADEYMEGVKNGYRLALIHMKNTPMEEEQKHGEWIEKGENNDGTHNIVCNVCHNGVKARGHAKSYNTIKKWKYCPNCGSDMRPKVGESE